MTFSPWPSTSDEHVPLPLLFSTSDEDDLVVNFIEFDVVDLHVVDLDVDRAVVDVGAYCF